MLSIISYPYNLLCNIYTIICYIKEIYCSGNYEYLYSTTLIVMFQILKFNAKIIEYHKNIKLKKKFCSKVISQKQTSISILVKYYNNFYCINIRNINNNNNDHEHISISDQLVNQRKILNIPNITYILYIHGNKLKENIEEIIIENNPNVHIMYNKLYFPINKNNKLSSNIILTQSALGYIISYYNTDYMYNLMVAALMKYNLYTTDEFYTSFDKRMNESNIDIERYRWNKIKKIIKILDFSNKKNIVEIDNIIKLYNNFFKLEIRKKYIDVIKYGLENNCVFITRNNEFSNINDDILNIIKINTIGIFGSGEDNEYKNKNNLLQYIILLKYKLYFMYIVLFKL